MTVTPTVPQLVDQLAEQLAQADFCPETALVGIRTRGVPLAQRLADRLRPRLNLQLPVGSLDITFYRDDLAQRQNWPLVRGSDIPCPVDGADLLVVDDVLHTGRTIVAAMRALLDLGRPRRLRLITLVDRPGREFPIQADFTAWRVHYVPSTRVQVKLVETDGIDELVLP